MMSGQREQQFRVGPGYNGPAANPAPTVSTAHGTYRAAHHTVDTSGLAMIGDALGSFFGGAAKTAQNLDEIEHRENLEGIKRENDVLAHQAAADQAAGKARDPAMAKRWSYESTFTRALADDQAHSLAQAWTDRVRAAPRDGTFNYDAERESFFKENIGAGSGDPHFDATHMVAFKKQTDAGREQFQGEVFRTVEGNNQRVFQASVAGKLDRQFGLLPSDVTEGLAQARVMAQGNEDHAMRLFSSAVLSNVNTEFQATSVMMALDKAGLREQSPDLYRHISEKASAQINQVRTLETRTSLDRLQARVVNALVAPTIDLDGVQKLQEDIKSSARAFGAQDDHQKLLARLYALRKQMATDVADENLYDRAMRGNLTAEEAARTGAVEMGTFISKHQDKAFGRYMDDAAAYPNLAATKTEYGTFRPLASKETASEFAAHVTKPNVLKATAGLMPDTYKQENDRAILGSDASAAGNAFALADNIARRSGRPDLALEAFKSDEAKRRYQAYRSAMGNQRPEELVQLAANNPDAFKKMQQAEDGTLDFATLPGQAGKKSADVRKEIMDGLTAQLRDQHGLDKWFGFIRNPNVGFANERVANDMVAGVVRQMSEQARLRPGTVPDIGAAVKAEVELHKGRTDVLPGAGGTFIVYPRTVDDKKGSVFMQPFEGVPGRKVYRMGLVTNALGEVEDTRENFAADVKELARLFPEQGFEPKKMAFGQPEQALAQKGLYRVINGVDAIAFEPGQQVTLTVPNVPGLLNKATAPATMTIPEDPAEARRMLHQVLGHTGWKPEEPDETYGVAGRHVIRLVYGGRIEKDSDWVKQNDEVFRARAGGAVSEAQMAQDALKAGGEQLSRASRRPH